MKAKIIQHQGCAWIEINGQLHEPVSFRSFRPAPETVRRFDLAGFSLFSVFPSGILCSLKVPYSQFGEVWTGDRQYDWSALKAQTDLFLEQAPDSYWSLMLQLDTRDWFLASHPELADSFMQLVQTVASPVWRQAAAAMVCDLLDFLDEHVPNKVYGVYLMAGGTTEWYTRDIPAALRPCPAQTEAYRAWSGDPLAEIPPPDVLHRTQDGVLRDPAHSRQALDYWRFYNEAVSDAICWFARQIKEHTGGTRLVGAFYGYITGMDLPHVVLSNYNDLLRVLEDKNIDALFCPASYRFRKLASTSGLRVPLDSFTLHGKLYFHEIDNTTWRVNDNPLAQALQKSHTRLKDRSETESYFKREIAQVLAKGQGYWWFDMFGGWYDDPALMETIRRLRLLTQSLWRRGMEPAEEVGFFIDMPSNYLLGTQSGYDMVEYQTELLNRMGLPWACYLTDDLLLDPFPRERIRLYIFANLFQPDARVRAAVKALRQAGKSVLFLHAPGYVTDAGFSLESMTDLTGFHFRRDDAGSGQVSIAPGPWLDGKTPVSFGFSRPCPPLFAVTDQDVTVVGRDSVSLQPALVVRRHEHGLTTFCSVGRLPAGLLRALARQAGAFVYSDSDDPLFLNRQMVALYAHRAGIRRLRWPVATRLEDPFSHDSLEIGPAGADIAFSDQETRIFTVSGPSMV